MNKNTFNPKRNGFVNDVFVLSIFGACVYFGFFAACFASIGG